MNHKIKYLLFAVLLIASASCKSDDGPSEKDLAFQLLAGDWSLGTGGYIKVDDQDISANFPGFRLSFTNGGFSTLGAGDLFNATGSWQWTNASTSEIVTDGARNIKILSLTQSRFNFTFSFAGTGGVANGIGGSYNILVVK